MESYKEQSGNQIATTVTYKHHDGAHKDTEWGGRMELAKSGQQKIAVLHCFLVSTLVKL